MRCKQVSTQLDEVKVFWDPHCRHASLIHEKRFPSVFLDNFTLLRPVHWLCCAEQRYVMIAITLTLYDSIQQQKNKNAFASKGMGAKCKHYLSRGNHPNHPYRFSVNACGKLVFWCVHREKLMITLTQCVHAPSFAPARHHATQTSCTVLGAVIRARVAISAPIKTQQCFPSVDWRVFWVLLLPFRLACVFYILWCMLIRALSMKLVDYKSPHKLQ